MMQRLPPATYADVLAAPEHKVAELIDGELILSPRPALRHAAAASVIGEELGPPFKRGRGGPGGWIIIPEPEIHFGPQPERLVLVPDLAGWRRERMALLPDAAYSVLPPDWLCEVLSPGTARLDRFRKLPLYHLHGVGHVWLVDPIARSLEVFRRAEAGWTLVATHLDTERVRAEPFDAIELDLSLLWADTVAPPARPAAEAD